MRSDRGRLERARAARSSGFSILELAIVLTLLTVIAAIAIPLFYGRASITLDSAAILLARDLRVAQNTAVFREKDVIVQFLPEGDGYRVYDEFGAMLPNPTGGGDFVRRYSQDGVFEGVELEYLDVGPNRSVHFTQGGVALHGAEVHLRFGGERRKLTVEPTTGLVTLEGLRRSWRDDGR